MTLSKDLSEDWDRVAAHECETEHRLETYPILLAACEAALPVCQGYAKYISEHQEGGIVRLAQHVVGLLQAAITAAKGQEPST